MSEFVAKRLSQLKSSIGVKPEELLQALLYELETGAIKAERMVVVYEEPDRSDGTPGDICRWRANCTRQEEVHILDLAHYGALAGSLK